MIRATIKHEVPPNSPSDLPLFLDLDLEVLAVSTYLIVLGHYRIPTCHDRGRLYNMPYMLLKYDRNMPTIRWRTIAKGVLQYSSVFRQGISTLQNTGEAAWRIEPEEIYSGSKRCWPKGAYLRQT